MFGDDLTFDIENIYRTRIPKGQLPKLFKFIEKLACKPLISRQVLKKSKNSNWSDKVLSMEHVLRAAYVAYGLSRCFANLPPVINDNTKVEDDDEIGFNFDDENDVDDQEDGQIMDYGQIRVGATAEIEFFEGTFSMVYLLDAV